MINKTYMSWSIKPIIAILIIQMMALGYFANLQMTTITSNNSVNVFTPCPKAEIQTNISQQICKSHLNFSLNSIQPILSFFTLPNTFFALADDLSQYQLLIYSIFKPPKK